jgi:uncharacterized protein YcfL
MEKILTLLLISLLSISCSTLQYANYEYEEDVIEETDTISNQVTDSIQIEATCADNKQKRSTNGNLYIMYNGRTYDHFGRLIY